MHSGIVNGYQLLCDTHTVLEPHRGTAAFYYFPQFRPFPLFLFMCLSLKDICMYTPLAGRLYNNLVVLKVLLNPTKLNSDGICLFFFSLKKKFSTTQPVVCVCLYLKTTKFLYFPWSCVTLLVLEDLFLDSS